MAAAFFMFSIAVAIIVGTKYGFGIGTAAFFILFGLIVMLSGNDDGH